MIDSREMRRLRREITTALNASQTNLYLSHCFRHFENCKPQSDPNATATTTATIAINTQKLEEICTPFADKRRELIDELRSLREKANRWRAELRKDAAVAVNDTMGSFDPMQCWQAEVLDGPSTATSKDDDNNDAKNIASSSKSAEPSITVEDDCRHLERLLDELEGFAPHPHQQSDWTSLTGLEDVLARFVSLQKEGLERCDAMETTVAALRANVLEPIDNPTEEQIAKMVIDAKQGNFLPEDQWPDVMRACLVMDKAAKRLGRVEAGLANVQAKLER